MADLSDEDIQFLKELREKRENNSISRRAALGLVGGTALGAGGVVGSGEFLGSAKADASTSDSDGNVGAPNNRVDVFADGFDAETQLTLPQYSDDSNAPLDCFFFNDSESKAKYKDAAGTVYTAFTATDATLSDSGSDNADGGDIYVLPGAEDSLSGQGMGTLINWERLSGQALSITQGRGLLGLPNHHVNYASGLSNEEIARFTLPSGDSLEVWMLEAQLKGGGTNSNVTLDVYDAAAGTSLASVSGGARTSGGSSPLGTSSTGATITVRLSTGSSAVDLCANGITFIVG
jgi:hypothetical protein